MRKGVLLVALFGAINLYGQKYNEIGITIGLSGMAGDFNDPWGNVAAALYELRPNIGVEYRHYFSPRHNMYTAFRMVHVHTHDANYGKPDGYKLNGNISSLELRYELNLRRYTRSTNSIRTQVDSDWWTPYIGVGVSAIYFNPNVQLRGNDPFPGYDNSVGFSGDVQIALGIKFDLPRGLGMALEFSEHSTFTDRLDAYTQGELNDWFYQLNLSICMLLIKKGYY
ncbi:MAG: outer membrane beta-barrel protein [Flavobacteriales bacterium]|nr:outer membrane beta-barrel protein [Flavobacteriales bacterium]